MRARLGPGCTAEQQSGVALEGAAEALARCTAQADAFWAAEHPD